MTLSDDDKNMVQENAASTIQKNFRGFQDRLKVREQAAFNISQLIEYSEEQDHLNLNKFFSRWIQLIKSNDASKYVQKSEENIDESKIKIESDYNGPHLNEIFNQKEFLMLINAFKKNQILHSKYALMILNKGIAVLKHLKNLNDISCFDRANLTDVKVNIIGDLHGQFADLFHIFETFGIPAENNIYLFNGDFVDRGPQQCEVFLTLLYALVLYKDTKCFFLNRGNHEDYGCSVRFGFKEEIMNKYVMYSKLFLKKCVETFTRLPVGSIVTQENTPNNPPLKILVVHGGISQETDLEMIKDIDRTRFDNIDGTIDASLNEKEKKEKQQLQDLLWSDPQANQGCIFNKQRHIAKQFGPDTTELVIKKYGLSLIIRSHECKHEGYEFHHNKRCLTIFSASNYCGGINKGAICILKPKKRLEIQQFVAPGYENGKNNERIEIFENKAIRNLKRLLYANREALMKGFKGLDGKNSGYLTLGDWADTLTKTMGIANIPWVRYKDKLVEFNVKKALVKYETSFENCDVLHTFSTESKDINNALARYKETLIALFNLIDDNHSGTINLREFANACKIIFHDRNEIISDSAIKSMIEAMDSNKDGKIDLSEFEQAFVVFV
jgi:serine/threonine-protein phosphatase with EF-hand domain